MSPALLANASPRKAASGSTLQVAQAAPDRFDPAQAEATRRQVAQVNAFLDGTPQGKMILEAMDRNFVDMDAAQAEKLRELLVLAGRMRPVQPALEKGSVAPGDALRALAEASELLQSARTQVESAPTTVAQALTGNSAVDTASRLMQALDVAHHLARQLAAVEPRQLERAQAEAMQQDMQAYRDQAASLLEAAGKSGDPAVLSLAQRTFTSANFANNDMLMGLAEARMGAVSFGQAYQQALGDQIETPYARAAAQRMNQGRRDDPGGASP